MDAQTKVLESLVEKNPMDVRALHRLGNHYHKIGRISEAVDILLRVAKQHHRGSEWSLAIALYRQVLKWRPEFRWLHGELARACHESGRTKEALMHLWSLMESQREKGHLVEALETVEEGLSMAGHHVQFWVKAAQLRVELGELVEAVASFEEALFYAEEQSKWDACLEIAAELLEVRPGHLGAFRLGAWAALVSKTPRRAQNWLRRALLHHPEDPVLLEMMADAHLDSGEKQEAIALLERLALAAAEDPDRARSLHERILSFDPQHEGAKQALCNLQSDADWSFEEVEEEEVHEPWQPNPFAPAEGQAPALAPESLGFHLRRIEACLRYEKYDQAERLLREASTVEPLNPRLQQLQAEFFAKQGRGEDAAGILLFLADSCDEPTQARSLLERLLSLDGVSADIRSLARHLLLQLSPVTQPTQPRALSRLAS